MSIGLEEELKTTQIYLSYTRDCGMYSSTNNDNKDLQQALDLCSLQQAIRGSMSKLKDEEAKATKLTGAKNKPC